MKPYSDESSVLSDKLPDLKPILQSWLKVQERYNDAIKDSGEFAWVYGERPCVGFLSAAAWDCGGVTVLESPTKKQGPNGQPGYGWNDLYIFLDKKHIVIEAKNLPSYGTSTTENDLNSIRIKLAAVVAEAAACQDVSPIPKEQPSLYLGILFIIRSYPPNNHPSNFNENITEWLEGVASIEHDAMAWLFPRKEFHGNSTEWVSPGIVLLARTPELNRTPLATTG